MPPVNRTIVTATVIIMASGAYHFLVSTVKPNYTLTRVIVGGFMLGFFASLFDLIGFGVGQVAGYILMLAMGVAIFTVIQDVMQRFNTTQTRGTPTSAEYAGQNPHMNQA